MTTTDTPSSPIDGAALLNDVEAFHRRFNVFPREAAYVAVTLWDAHAHDPGASLPQLHHIVGIDYDPVITGTAIEHISATIAANNVITCASNQRVISRSSD